MHTLFLSCLLTLTHTGLYPNLPEPSPGEFSDSYIAKNDDVARQNCWGYLSPEFARNVVGTVSRKVLQKVDISQPGSYVVSPIGITLNLYMLNNGLVDESYRRVQKILGYENRRCISIVSMQSLVDELATYKDLGLRMGNRVFASSKMQVNPKFTSMVTTTYRSAIQKIDFENGAEASTIISSWCEETTNNHEDIVTKRLKVNADTSVAIASVVYFKRKWLNPFAVKKTKPHSFTDTHGVNRQVPTMNKIMNVRYREIPNMNISFFELPFEPSIESTNSAKTNATGMSMFVITPLDISNPTSLESVLESGIISKSLYEAESSPIRIKMPKFRLESDIDVKVPVETIASGGVFPQSSKFTGIADAPNLVYHEWEQKTVLSVDEDGVEISTTETIGEAPSADNTPFTDRLFYILICTYPNTDIIFAARASI